MSDFEQAIVRASEKVLQTPDSRRGFISKFSKAGAGFLLPSNFIDSGVWTDPNWFPFDAGWGLPSFADVARPLDDVLVAAGRKPGILEWEDDFITRVLTEYGRGRCHALAIAGISEEKPLGRTTYYKGIALPYITKLAGLVGIHQGDPTIVVPAPVAYKHLERTGRAFIADMPDEPGVWIRAVDEAYPNGMVRVTAWGAGKILRHISKAKWAAYPVQGPTVTKNQNAAWINPYIAQNEDVLREAIFSI